MYKKYIPGMVRGLTHSVLKNILSKLEPHDQFYISSKLKHLNIDYRMGLHQYKVNSAHH